MLLHQVDVTERANAEGAMSDLTDAQLAMLSQVHAAGAGSGLVLYIHANMHGDGAGMLEGVGARGASGGLYDP